MVIEVRSMWPEGEEPEPPVPFAPGTITSIPSPPDPFEPLVRAALDELPDEFLATLETVSFILSDEGQAWGAYGLYQGASIANPGVPAQISIFRDTLFRDFGHDPELLAAQVRRVVRHEVGHHLGFDEDGVARLGL
jgi:predicted Zn-dependent protease with MMP-like domain